MLTPELLKSKIKELENENFQLIKEAANQKQHAEKLMEDKDDMFTSLLIANHDNDLQKIEIEGLKYDKEKLMRLLKVELKDTAPCPNSEFEEYWQSYCKENNINPLTQKEPGL